MRAIVLDQTFGVAFRARSVLDHIDGEVHCAGSVEELGFLLAVGGAPFDVLIVNIAGSLTAADLESYLREHPFSGETIVFLGIQADAATVRLRDLSRTLCAPRPASETHIDQLLHAFIGTRRNDALPQKSAAEPDSTLGIVGECPEMRAIRTGIRKFAIGDANVCIAGEHGVGKEIIARAIHQYSDRCGGPFVVFDCAAIPKDRLEGQLFGHVPGSSAGDDHGDGVLSLADKGTLFIEEPGTLSPPLQDKLLRVLQTHEFFKVGSTQPSRSDVRIVTATTRDLAEAVKTGAFREELFYRVAVVMIHVPSLRERRADILLLVNHFVRKYAALHHRATIGVSASAMQRIVASPWPGNVRQLETVIEQAVILSTRDILTEDQLFASDEAPRRGSPSPPAPGAVALTLREVERQHIMRTLEAVRGSRTEAARLLAISVRCLQYKLKTYARDDHGRPLARITS